MTFLGFKFDLRFLRILKLFGGICFTYPYLISSQSSLFIPDHRSIERQHRPEIDSGTSFFLVKTLKNF